MEEILEGEEMTSWPPVTSPAGDSRLLARREEPGGSEAGVRGEGEERCGMGAEEFPRTLMAIVCKGRVSEENELQLPDDSTDLMRRRETRVRLARMTLLMVAMDEVLVLAS